MRYLIAILLFVAAYAYAEVRMLGNVEDGKILIYAIDPTICKADGVVQYDGNVLVVESIICGDSIFADGFDGQL